MNKDLQLLMAQYTIEVLASVLNHDAPTDIRIRSVAIAGEIENMLEIIEPVEVLDDDQC
jgi:hypothetical protein